MTIRIKDGDGTTKELAAVGTGTAGDPYYPTQSMQVDDGADIALGATADAAVAAGLAGTVNAKLRRLTADLGAVLNFIDGLEGLLAGGLPAALTGSGALKVANIDPIPAGDANIGNVDVLTLPAGTVAGGASLPAGTNNIGDVDVLSLPALPAGANNIGDVDVLTLPAGTVAGAASLPAGTNNIGDVDVLTLPAGTVAGSASLPAGTNNIGDVDVLSLPALPAGANVVGKVGIDQTTPGTTNRVYLTDINAGDYETVAASQTNQALGATGAVGDYLSGVLIVPATTSPGAVIIKDGANAAITIFTGGATSVSNLVPFFVPLGIVSGNGAWQVTTGANVSAIGVGNCA
jgi:hypothetical protein